MFSCFQRLVILGFQKKNIFSSCIIFWLGQIRGANLYMTFVKHLLQAHVLINDFPHGFIYICVCVLVIHTLPVSSTRKDGTLWKSNQENSCFFVSVWFWRGNTNVGVPCNIVFHSVSVMFFTVTMEKTFSISMDISLYHSRGFLVLTWLRGFRSIIHSKGEM